MIRNVPRKNHARALQLNPLEIDEQVLRAGAQEAAQLTGRDRGVRPEDLQLEEEARRERDIVQEGKKSIFKLWNVEMFVAHVIAHRVIEIAGYRRHQVDLITFANGRHRIVFGKLK